MNATTASFPAVVAHFAPTGKANIVQAKQM